MNETKPLHLKIDQSSIDQSSRSQSVGHVKTVLKYFFFDRGKERCSYSSKKGIESNLYFYVLLNNYVLLHITSLSRIKLLKVVNK